MPIVRSNSGWRTWFLLSAIVLSTANGALGQDAGVPEPWNDLLKNELVVVGRYKSHKNGVLSLRVVEVLRGKDRKPGEILSVKLAQTIGFKFQVVEHANGTTGVVEKFLNANDGTTLGVHSPRMYYLEEQGKQIQETLITWNAERNHTYFFAKDGQPVLERPNQLQANRPRGWKKALEGKPVDLSFQMLLHPVEAVEMTRKATDELFKSREREAIAGLVDALLEPRALPAWHQTRTFAQHLLLSLGDKNGDVYDPILQALLTCADTNDAAALAWLLPRLDRKRALADFKKVLEAPRGSHEAISGALVALDSEDALDLMFERMQAGSLQAYYALEGMMFNRHGYDKGTRMVERARLQELAVPRLKKLLKNRSLPGQLHDFAMFDANFRFLVEEPPPDYQGWRVGTGFHLAKRCPRRDGLPDWQRLEWEARDDLEPILKADLVEGRKRLKERLANAPRPGPNGPYDLLILQDLAYRYGDVDMAKKFKKPADSIVRVRHLDSNKANNRGVPILHFMPAFSDTLKLSSDYHARLLALFPEHAGAYFRELEALIVSEDKPRREFAIRLLEERFSWNFDFDADDYPIAAKRKVEAIKPLLTKLSKSSDLLEMRGMLLRHFGVNLNGPPGRAWLPAIEEAVLRWNKVVHLNALCVLGMIEEDPDVMRFGNYPPIMRAKELQAHLQQRRAKKNDLPATEDFLKGLWKDLDNPKQAVSYAAMKTVLQGYEPNARWLAHRLKQQPRDPVRDVRAIQVLEYMPGREARMLLEDLAAGPAGSATTHEANCALRRLARFWRW